MFVANIVTMSGLALETAQFIIFIHTLCSVLSTAFVLGIHFLKIQLLLILSRQITSLNLLLNADVGSDTSGYHKALDSQF